MSKYGKNHNPLKKQVCEAHGHTWTTYDRSSTPGRLFGMNRRVCKCCGRDEWGKWKPWTKHRGWVFETWEVWRP